jgi:hypothetical protein
MNPIKALITGTGHTHFYLCGWVSTKREDGRSQGGHTEAGKNLCKLTATAQQLNVCMFPHTQHFQSHIDVTCVEEHLTYDKTHTVLH